MFTKRFLFLVLLIFLGGILSACSASSPPPNPPQPGEMFRGLPVLEVDAEGWALLSYQTDQDEVARSVYFLRDAEGGIQWKYVSTPEELQKELVGFHALADVKGLDRKEFYISNGALYSMDLGGETFLEKRLRVGWSGTIEDLQAYYRFLDEMYAKGVIYLDNSIHNIHINESIGAYDPDMGSIVVDPKEIADQLPSLASYQDDYRYWLADDYVYRFMHAYSGEISAAQQAQGLPLVNAPQELPPLAPLYPQPFQVGEMFRGKTVMHIVDGWGTWDRHVGLNEGEFNVWFQVLPDGGTVWKRTNMYAEEAQIYWEAAIVQAEHKSIPATEVIKIGKYSVLTPDWAELDFYHFLELHNFDEDLAKETVYMFEEYLEGLYPRIAIFEDYGPHNILIDANGEPALADLEFTLVGQDVLDTYPTLQDYQNELRAGLSKGWSNWVGETKLPFNKELLWPDTLPPVGIGAAHVDDPQVQLPSWMANPEYWVSLEATQQGTQMSVMSVVDNGSYQFFLPEGQALTRDFLTSQGIPVPQATALETALNNTGRFLGKTGKLIGPLLRPVGIGVIVVGSVYGGYLDYAQIIGIGPIVVQTYDSWDVNITDPSVAQDYIDLGLTTTNAYHEQMGPSLNVVAEILRKRSEGCTKDSSYVLGIDEAGRFSLNSIGVLDRDITTPIVVGPHPDVTCTTESFWPSAINYTNQVTGETVTWFWDGVASWFRDTNNCMNYTAPVISGTGTWPFPFKLCWFGIQEYYGPDVIGVEWPIK